MLNYSYRPLEYFNFVFCVFILIDQSVKPVSWNFEIYSKLTQNSGSSKAMLICTKLRIFSNKKQMLAIILMFSYSGIVLISLWIFTYHPSLSLTPSVLHRTLHDNDRPNSNFLSKQQYSESEYSFINKLKKRSDIPRSRVIYLFLKFDMKYFHH